MAWAEIAAAREARPNLLGLELEPFPYASAFSVLLRITRLMDLEPTEWFRTVGVRYSTGVMALPDLRLGRVSRLRFEAALGLTNTQVPTWWCEEAWSPLRTGGLLDRAPRPIRWCWHCAAYGYHTALFQLPSIHSCPWHEFPLLDSCPTCNKPGSALVDAQGTLGRCDCGFDWLKIDKATVGMWSFPTTQAEAWMASYLAWAAEQRRRRCAIVPQGSARWMDGYAVLAQPALEFSNNRGGFEYCGTLKEDFDDGPDDDPPSAHFWGWGALGDDRPLTYVPLPPETLTELTCVTRQVIAGLPRDARAQIEMASFSDLDHGATLGDVARRVECFIAPHGRAADGFTWLNVSAVDHNTLQLCGQLIDEVIHACNPDPTDGDHSRQASRALVLGTITGRWRLAAALNKILAHGYAQGLNAILRSSLELPQPKEWSLPVAEFEVEASCLTRVRVCWVPAPPPRLRGSMVPPGTPAPGSGDARRHVRGRRSARGKPGRRSG